GSGPAGLAAARKAGARLAGSLMPGPNADLASPLQPLEALGGQYDLSRPGEIVARNCLFRAACHASSAVCEVHTGLLEALFEPSSPGVRVDSSGQDGVSGCRYRLSAATG